MSDLYTLHPIAVHFPIALLLTGAAFKLSSEWSYRPAFQSVSLWLLRVGAVMAAAAAGLGLLAAKTVPHVPAAWETMADHKALGLWAAGMALVLWGLEEWNRRTSAVWRVWGVRLLWMAVVALLVAAGNEGGELVYLHGVGVQAAPHL